MSQTVANLVDHVIPCAPVHQCVMPLSILRRLPFRRRAGERGDGADLPGGPEPPVSDYIDAQRQRPDAAAADLDVHGARARSDERDEALVSIAARPG